ncbi:MAG: hypothetical protein OEW42_18960 [Acidimicrobiia bacterium]|nr:hypothetical protein [Acidimicrobiia bacterium]
MRRLLLLLCLIALSACGGGSDLTAPAPDLDALAAAPLIDLDGDPAEPLALDPSRPTAIWFTTPWCRQCEPQLQEALAAAAEVCDAHLVIVIGRAAEGAIGQYVDANTVPSTCTDPPRIVTDPTGQGFGSVPVITAPTWLFVTGDVEVVRDRVPVDQLTERLAR